MKLKSTLIAIGLVGAFGATAAPAFADDVIRFGNQDFGVQLRLDNDRDGPRHDRHVERRHGEPRHIGQRQVRRILRHRGFEKIGPIDYQPRRGVYVARAENRRDRDVRVVVDARNGRIIDVDRIRRDRQHQRPNPRREDHNTGGHRDRD